MSIDGDSGEHRYGEAATMPGKHVSNTVSQLRISAIKEMAMRSAQVPGAVSLAWGLPSFRTPSYIRSAVQDALERDADIGKYALPEGAYYVFPRIVAAHEDDVQFSLDLLRQVSVIVTPGSAFGERGEHHVRMAYCVSEDVINTAFDRIERHFGSA